MKEQLKETWLDLAKTMDELDKNKEALSVEKRNEEAERATHVLNKLQDTYQKKVVDYESQAQAAAAIIIRLRQEK